MPDGRPPLSLVFPAFDEARRIGDSLAKARAWLDVHSPHAEVLVVDDGSRDGTAALVEGLAQGWPALRLIRLGRNQGKGAATRRGVLEARGAWILCSDADLSTPIEETARLLAAGERAPVVIGSRSIDGANITRRQPLHRVAMGRAFNLAVRAVTPGRHADTQCGFKLYRHDAAQDLFSRLTVAGFAFDAEVLFLAHALGYPVAEVPVTWHNDERSSVNVWRDPARMLVDIAKVRWRHRRL
ncbi:MAG: dolichyl-phosphate beta-glucosyltransferase [Pseudomonadota bacterium]